MQEALASLQVATKVSITNILNISLEKTCLLALLVQATLDSMRYIWGSVMPQTLRNALLNAMPEAEARLKILLPKNFGIMFDGQSKNEHHYVVVLAIGNNIPFYVALLSFSSIESNGQTATKHID